MVLTLVVTALLITTTPDQVIDPRPASHVVDLTGTLSARELNAIDAEAARGAVGGELLVVVVPSTGGVNARAWTTTLFNRLRLDSQDRNRGVLLMAAINDRKAEIVIGDGFAGKVTSTTDSIMAGTVVARFKAGDPKGAMLQGARALVDRVLLSGVAKGAIAGNAAAIAKRKSWQPSAAERAAAEHAVVQSVPDPRASGGVVDGAGLLRPSDVAEIRAARAQGGDEKLVVVTARETGGLGTTTFARGLFLRLRLAPDSGRGKLLVVVAPEVTASSGDAPEVIEIVLGDAYPEALAVSTAKKVSEAWYQAVTSNPAQRSAATVSAARSLATLDDAAAPTHSEAAAKTARSTTVAGAGAGAAQPDVRGGARRERSGFSLGLGAWGLLLGGGFLGARETLRRRPRTCSRCKVRMERLAEEVDDQHLSEGELAEERIGSVDYDIWSCPDCGDILKTRWGALFSSYSKCRSCSFRTLSSTRRTLSAATTYSSGLAEVTERCGHCSFTRTYTRSIPRKSSPSSRSRSSSSGRSSGGSSSGRGSSGSW